MTGDGYIQVDPNVVATWHGQITGNPGPLHALVKYGEGDLHLTGANTYSASTVVLQGGLRLGHGQALGASALSANVGSKLVFANGIQVGNTIGLLPLSASTYLPPWLSAPPSQGTGYENAVRWVVESGQAQHTGLLHGSAPLLKQGGGSLVLSGDSMGYWGPVLVENGQLVVNDFLLGQVTVGSGARLGGHGTLGGLLVHAGATVAPGAAGTALRVQGHAQLAAGSVFEVNVLPTGQASQLLVGGQAQLAGQVQALAYNGPWQDNTTFTIVQADGGVVGQFDGATSNLAFLDASLHYGDNQVQLALQRNDTPLTQPANPEDEEVADAVDSGPPAVKDAVLGTSPSGARQAFAGLANRWAPTLSALVVDDARYAREAVLAQGAVWGPGRQAVVQSNGLWATAFGGGSTQRSGWHAGRLHGKAGGFVAGRQWAVGQRHFAAVFLGGQTAGYNGHQHSARVRSGLVGASLQADDTGWQWQVGAIHHWNRLHASRTVQVGYLQNSLRSRYSSRVFQVFGETAFATPVQGVQAFGRLSWLHSHTPSFTESGGPMAVQVASQRRQVVVATLGARWQTPLNLGSNKAVWFGTVSLDAAAGQRRSRSTQQFAHGNGQTFTTTGTAIARNTVQLATGLRIKAGAFGWAELMLMGRVA